MYWKYKTIEEVIKHLNGYKADYEAKIELWKAVEVRKKKDGSEFVKLSTAVVGARFGQSRIEDYMHPELTVCGRSSRGLWVSESVDAYFYVDELPVEKQNRETIYKTSWSRPTSPYNAEELREAIQKHIKKLEEHIEELNAEIEAAPQLFTAYREAIKKAETELEEADKKIRKNAMYPTSLFYAIQSAN